MTALRPLVAEYGLSIDGILVLDKERNLAVENASIRNLNVTGTLSSVNSTETYVKENTIRLNTGIESGSIATLTNLTAGSDYTPGEYQNIPLSLQTPTVSTSVNGVVNEDTTVVLDTTANILAGMEVTGGNLGSGVTVNSVTNATTLELSEAVSLADNDNLTFTNPGTGATANISVNLSKEVESVSLVNTGIGYLADTVLQIDDAEISSREIATFSHNGATETGRTAGEYTPEADSNGARFRVVIAETTKIVSIELIDPGKDYNQNDTITLLGSDIGGGSDIVITVTAVRDPGSGFSIDVATINAGSAGTDAFIEVSRGTDGIPVAIKWDETDDRWKFTNNGSEYFDIFLASDADELAVSGKLVLRDGNGDIVVNDIAVNGGDITTTQATAKIFNGNATNITLGSASTTNLTLGGSSTATLTVGADLSVASGTLTLGGATSTATAELCTNATSVTIGGALTTVSTSVDGAVNTDTTVKLDTTAGIAEGMEVTGGNLGSDVTVASVTNGTTLELSEEVSLADNDNLTFTDPGTTALAVGADLSVASGTLALGGSSTTTTANLCNNATTVSAATAGETVTLGGGSTTSLTLGGAVTDTLTVGHALKVVEGALVEYNVVVVEDPNNPTADPYSGVNLYCYLQGAELQEGMVIKGTTKEITGIQNIGTDPNTPGSPFVIKVTLDTIHTYAVDSTITFTGDLLNNTLTLGSDTYTNIAALCNNATTISVGTSGKTVTLGGVSTDTLSVGADLSVSGGTLTLGGATSTTTANLCNNATTVEVATSGITVTLGGTSTTDLTLGGASTTALAVGDDLSVASGTLTLGGASTTTTAKLCNNATTIGIGNEAESAVTASIATSSTSSSTLTFGGTVSNNTLKIAGVAAGTVDVTTDVTTGTANIFTSVTGKIQLGAEDCDVFIGNQAAVEGSNTDLDADNQNTPLAVNSFKTAEFKSAEYLIQVEAGGQCQISKVLLIHKGTNPETADAAADEVDLVYITEYGTVTTDGNILGTVDAQLSGQGTNQVATLLVVPSTNNATTVRIVRTSIIA